MTYWPKLLIHFTQITSDCVLPISTSSYERGFNLINLIITKLRSSLKSKYLSAFMMIKLNGLPVAGYDPKEAIDKLYFNAKFTRHNEGY